RRRRRAAGRASGGSGGRAPHGVPPAGHRRGPGIPNRDGAAGEGARQGRGDPGGAGMIAILLSITALAWDGERLYVARPGGVDIYRDGKIVGTLGADRRVVMGLAFQGRRLAECGGRGGEEGQGRIWEEG